MLTYTFQFFFILCTISVVVVAILTHRADRREVVKRADSAYMLACEFVKARAEAGYYDPPVSAQKMKQDFEDKYFELIAQ